MPVSATDHRCDPGETGLNVSSSLRGLLGELLAHDIDWRDESTTTWRISHVACRGSGRLRASLRHRYGCFANARYRVRSSTWMTWPLMPRPSSLSR